MNVLLRKLLSTRLVPHLCLSNILSFQFSPSSVLYWHKIASTFFTLNTCLLFESACVCVSFRAWRIDIFFIFIIPTGDHPPEREH